MAKKSKTETAQTRKRIIDVAAKAFKSNGIEATRLALRAWNFSLPLRKLPPTGAMQLS